MQPDADPSEATGALRRGASLARRVAARTGEENVTFLAAGVAYYAFVSLLPAAVLALVVAATVGGQRLATVVVEVSADVLTESGQELLVAAIVDGPGQGPVTLISLPLTVWGALKVLRGLDIAFSEVYGVDGAVDLVDQLRDSLVVAASVGGSVVATLLLGALVAVLDVGAVTVVASYLALPGLLTLAFLPMYYVFPDSEVTLREVLPGAVFAGVGWTVLRAAFQAYVDLTAGGDGEEAVYGVLGAVLLFVTFLYFGATLVLVGAVVNVVLAGDAGADRGRSAVADARDRQDKGTDTRAK